MNESNVVDGLSTLEHALDQLEAALVFVILKHPAASALKEQWDGEIRNMRSQLRQARKRTTPFSLDQQNEIGERLSEIERIAVDMTNNAKNETHYPLQRYLESENKLRVAFRVVDEILISEV
jgi:hypothetical protein